MRYCVSSSCGATPALSQRSKSERINPPSAAASHTTVGRSCLWSPIKTNWRTPRVRGTRHDGSVDCAVSSISTAGKACFAMDSAPAPTHVHSTTSAPPIAAEPPSASVITPWSSGTTASARPVRTIGRLSRGRGLERRRRRRRVRSRRKDEGSSAARAHRRCRLASSAAAAAAQASKSDCE